MTSSVSQGKLDLNKSRLSDFVKQLNTGLASQLSIALTGPFSSVVFILQRSENDVETWCVKAGNKAANNIGRWTYSNVLSGNRFSLRKHRAGAHGSYNSNRTRHRQKPLKFCETSMQDSRVVRRPILLLSRKIETGAPESKKVGDSAVSGTERIEQPKEKIQLLAIANEPKNITVVQALPNISSKIYNEFPIDRARAVYPGLYLGASFNTYAELADLMQRFQNAKGVHLYIRSSRKLYPALDNMGGTIRSYNLDLMFADIYYSCTRGGRRFRRPSSTQASATHEVRNCPFNIKLRLTKDGQKLYIRDIYPAHNHYLDRNSSPRIPNPIITKTRPRSVQKPEPVIVPETSRIRALIKKDFGDDGKRIVLLTKTPQRLPVPVRITTADDKTGAEFQTDEATPRIIEGPFPNATIELSLDGSNFSAHDSETSPPESASRSSIDAEPECILGSEEKIVPDVDEEDHNEEAAGSVSAQAELVFSEQKPRIKEEVLDEFPSTPQAPHDDNDDSGFPCTDEAFVISRRQIIELVKFCPRCGCRVANRYYSDRTEALGIALICSGSHTIELSLGKRL